MSEFSLYLQLGVNHIADFAAYDHLLFLIALCARYSSSHVKQIILLITAFTVGHSLTLILATTKILSINTDLIEFLIPVTILLTCIYNVVAGPSKPEKTLSFHPNYALALFFGLIHGLGFSSYLQTLLGKQSSIIMPLFAFNVGIELGQLVIVAVLFFLLFVLQYFVRVQQRDWNIFLSGLASGISLILIFENKLW